MLSCEITQLVIRKYISGFHSHQNATKVLGLLRHQTQHSLHRSRDYQGLFDAPLLFRFQPWVFSTEYSQAFACYSTGRASEFPSIKVTQLLCITCLFFVGSS